MKITSTKNNSLRNIILLILAGEAVFILPFVIARIFRPTLLEVFDITNTELGYCFSIYGIIAMISYGLGGFIADRFEPRKLIALSLVLTSLGGLFYGNNPSLESLRYLYGYWGFTTIFLFWAAMIKATRLWGGENDQGKAFGFLDGGRGLVGVLIGVLGVTILALVAPSENSLMSLSEKKEAMQLIIYASSIGIAGIGILVYLFLKFDEQPEYKRVQTFIWSDIKDVVKIPSVWLLMIIIVCAYFGYKVTDVLSQYSSDVLSFNTIDSGKVGTYLLFIRPLVGISIGFVADRSKPSLYLILGFICCILGCILFITNSFGNTKALYMLSVTITALGVYAVRVLYFAVMKEGKIPLKLTGTAVGLISLVGYTPDIFAGPLIGYYLDHFSGKTGYDYLFIWFAAFSVIGTTAAFMLNRYSRN